jgi:hypothetical protein
LEAELIKETVKKARSGGGKAGTGINQAEIDDFAAEISHLIGRTVASASGILDDATHKIEDLAGDETLKPVFKELREYLKGQNNLLPSIFDLLDKVSV